MAYLNENGVPSFTAERNVIVNLANEPNLSLEGYSAMFNGYDIYIEPDQKDFALEKIKEFLESTRRPDLKMAEVDSAETALDRKSQEQALSEKKILYILFFGVLFPLVNLPFLVGPLYKYFAGKYSIRIKFIVQLFVLLMLNFIYASILFSYFRKTFLS